jgi:hypothetical protein
MPKPIEDSKSTKQPLTAIVKENSGPYRMKYMLKKGIGLGRYEGLSQLGQVSIQERGHRARQVEWMICGASLGLTGIQDQEGKVGTDVRCCVE